jgi:hypothetical protein
VQPAIRRVALAVCFVDSLLTNALRSLTDRWNVRAACRWAIGLTVLSVYLISFLRISWRVGDEGTIVYGAQRVLEGATPYRDFIEVMGPGAFYWHALWFSVLGISWTTTRIALLVTALGCASAIYYITTRRYSGPFAVLPAAIYSLVTVPLWPAVSHHFDANLWVLLGCAVVVGSPGTSAARSVVGGLLLGIGATIMPQKGTYVALALLVGMVMDRPEGETAKRAITRTLWMLVPFASVGVSVIGYFWLRGGLPDLLNATLVLPATRYHSVNTVPYAFGLSAEFLAPWASIFRALFPWPLTGLAAVALWLPLVVVAASPALVAVLAVVRLLPNRLRRLTSSAPLPWSYLLAACALFASEIHRPDIFHLAYGSPLLLVVVTCWLAGLRSRPSAIAHGILTFSTILTGVSLLFLTVGHNQVISTRRGQIVMDQRDEALEFIQNNVAPGEPIFVYPYYPMYYFMANVRNPTRYSILIYGYNKSDEFQEAVHSIDSARVKFVLWDTLVSGENLRQWFPNYSDPPEDHQTLERYLKAHYRLVGIKNGFRVLQRLEPGRVEGQAPTMRALR